MARTVKKVRLTDNTQQGADGLPVVLHPEIELYRHHLSLDRKAWDSFEYADVINNNSASLIDNNGNFGQPLYFEMYNDYNTVQAIVSYSIYYDMYIINWFNVDTQVQTPTAKIETLIVDPRQNCSIIQDTVTPY